jgi:hypothetical protein
MKILFDNPKKKPWSVVAHKYDATYVEFTGSYNKSRYRADSTIESFNNPVFEAALEYKSIHQNASTSWVNFRDIEDGFCIPMKTTWFTILMKHIQGGKFRFDGRSFFGRYTFENVSGYLYAIPYLVD